MRNLIIQTFTDKDVDTRPTSGKFTYRSFPDLEEASRKSVQWYADKIGADYELYTDEPEWYDKYPGAHWHRMVLFERDYDNVLYLDHDLVINPNIRENIFQAKGVGVRVGHPTSVARIGWRGFNGGVMKLNREQRERMGEVIHDYYHPEKNQEALNHCYVDVFGKEPKYLDVKWNHTWQPDQKVINIKHFPGAQRQAYPMNPMFRYWKEV